MYPLVCPGGYGIPMKTGRFEICQIRAAVTTPANAAQLKLADYDITAAGGIPGTKDSNHVLLADLKKGTEQVDIGMQFKEPIKVRNGICPLTITNLVPGSIFVYIR